MTTEVLEDILRLQLKPLVRKIDREAYYPRDFLISIGKSGFFLSEGLSDQEIRLRYTGMIEQTAKVCMTTAFNLWCHLAALTFISKSSNTFIKKEILPLLENGETLGATGLSNSMKYYAGLEKLHLKAKRTDGGYIISGHLPAVSNLGKGHWFGVIAEAEKGQRIMSLLPSNAEGLILKEKRDYLGVNGSATYVCEFQNVYIPDKWMISEQADAFVSSIRPAFVLYQIPLGLGVTAASIESIQKVSNKQGGSNQYLRIQPDELLSEMQIIREKLYRMAESSDINQHWREIVELRLKVVELTAKSTHAAMLHQGGAGYLQHSDPSRRLREAYFLLNLTPTVKQLEKMLCS
ncbi:acyl-CoA dehydrogenase [Bacillus sp. BGMRC 2118]|nr:acyl-CoA dehydrogenase [Bacillus sp. BGMRC 2118]